MDRFQVVADVLFVEGGLWAVRIVGCGRPVAGGVRGEDFVRNDDCVVQQTELELGVREDEAFAGCMFRGLVVDIQGKGTECVGVGRTYGLFHCFIGDVFVVTAGIDFGGWRKDGFGQAIGFAQA